jgi:hypothetical protein
MKKAEIQQTQRCRTYVIGWVIQSRNIGGLNDPAGSFVLFRPFKLSWWPNDKNRTSWVEIIYVASVGLCAEKRVQPIHWSIECDLNDYLRGKLRWVVQAGQLIVHKCASRSRYFDRLSGPWDKYFAGLFLLFNNWCRQMAVIVSIDAIAGPKEKEADNGGTNGAAIDGRITPESSL